MYKFYNLGFMRISVVLISIAVCIGLYSCDKIDNPLINHQLNNGTLSGPPTQVTSTTDDNVLKVLVEDYTGHLCTNCPTAAEKCEALANGANAQHIIMIQNNVTTTFASTLIVGTRGSGNLDSAYMVDYRTDAGNTWNSLFINGDNTGMPGTMVDRLYYNGTAGGSQDLFLNGIQDPSGPADSIIGQNNLLALIHIADSMYAPSTSGIFGVSMSVTTTLLNPIAGNKYFLVVALVEDSIFDWQDSVQTDIQYYLKRMTLRGVINGGGTGLGDSLSNNTSAQAKHYTYAPLDSLLKFNNSIITHPTALEGRKWNMAHMYVVAFVYQTTPTPSGPNDYYVLQAQRLHL